MLKRFWSGVIFGSGFSMALIVIGSLYVYIMLPKLIHFTLPLNSNLSDIPSSTIPSELSIETEQRDYSFFKPGEHMTIPSGGGLLAMSPASTPLSASRPNTYQLWLTETSLWELSTTGEQVSVKELKRPINADVSLLGKLMYDHLGLQASQSTTTISKEEIEMVRANKKASRDESLNGQLSMTKEGVVFVLPNTYQ